ncbi:MAG: hypothetical protein JO121_03825 [Deltaproteobacteria bacterium]|nr:hypothetical protein [Deltaproteobacteria bacterium]
MGEPDFDAVTVVAVAAIAEGLGLGDVAYFHTVFLRSAVGIPHWSLFVDPAI